MARYIPYVCVCYQPEQQPFVRSPRLLYDNQSSMYIIFIDFHLILLKRIQVEFSQIEIEM